MGTVVSFFLALGAVVVAYGWLGQGGGVAGLIFFGVLLIGVIINFVKPKSDTL